MRIIKNIDEFPAIRNPVVTIGSFDGVHLGHKAIVLHTCNIAKQNNGDSVAMTFFPHPQAVLYPDKKDFFVLNTLEEKSFLLDSLGIDYLIIIPFTKEFASISYDQFIKKYIAEQLKTKTLVIGYDHHFGSNRAGTILQLAGLGAEYGFGVKEVAAQYVNEVAVSSTKIRKALLAGDIATANTYLGYPYFISGNVVKGNGLGQKLDFPTANIEPDEKVKLIPANGAYAVKASVEGMDYNGMLNIGIRPTIGGKSRITEVNIFDFSSDIYGGKIKIQFIERLRDEVKFKGINELHDQLMKDKETVLKILSKKKSL